MKTKTIVAMFLMFVVMSLTFAYAGDGGFDKKISKASKPATSKVDASASEQTSLTSSGEGSSGTSAKKSDKPKEKSDKKPESFPMPKIKVCKGDMNWDGTVNWRDIDLFRLVLLFSENYGTPHLWIADCNNDHVVNWRDIDPFVAMMNQPATNCREIPL